MPHHSNVVVFFYERVQYGQYCTPLDQSDDRFFVHQHLAEDSLISP